MLRTLSQPEFMYLSARRTYPGLWPLKHVPQLFRELACRSRPFLKLQITYTATSGWTLFNQEGVIVADHQYASGAPYGPRVHTVQVVCSQEDLLVHYSLTLDLPVHCVEALPDTDQTQGVLLCTVVRQRGTARPRVI
jgi:hypothetical protein